MPAYSHSGPARPSGRPRKPAGPFAPRTLAPPNVRLAKLAAAKLRASQATEFAAAAEAEAEAAAVTAWLPDPGPQALAANSQADIIGYGGAAGGGKTDLVIGLAKTQHHKAIIFRREYPQLKDIVRRAKELTEGERLAFNANDNLMTLGSGQTIEFGAMKDPDDWEKYKGRPHDLKAYDEATEFLETQVRKSMGWLRTVRTGQRCRILMTFNPPTNVEGQWVVRFFGPWLDKHHPNPAKPGELRWYATIGGEDVERPDGEPFEVDGEAIIPTSRTFFPARLADNPRLMKTGYGRTLMALPEPLRSQLLYGDFEAGIGDDPWQVIPTAWVEAAQERWTENGGAGIPMTAIGADVAHGGKDKSVNAARHHHWFAPLDVHAGKDTPNGQTAAQFVMQILDDGAYVNVDGIGYGASAAERLAEYPPEGFGVQAYAVNVAMRSEYTDKSGKYRTVNIRAEMYWRLREGLDPNGPEPIALPPDPELKSDLCAGKYEITSAGIKIEVKADIAARLGRSPDKGDAVALAMLPNGGASPGAVGGQRAEFAAVPQLAPIAMPKRRIPGAF